MGQFSWMTDDTDTQIGSMRENTITVYMHDNKGNVWKEDEYDGYGVFGGKDYYDLVAEMNGYSKDNYMKYYKKGEKPMYDELRIVGIDIEGEYDKGERRYKFPTLVQREMSYEELDNHRFDTPPERDPNQGWYQPESEECEDCSGSGEIESQCDVCYGTGTIDGDEDEGGFTTSEECYSCDGSGEATESCYYCDGAGEITPGKYEKGGKTKRGITELTAKKIMYKKLEELNSTISGDGWQKVIEDAFRREEGEGTLNESNPISPFETGPMEPMFKSIKQDIHLFVGKDEKGVVMIIGFDYSYTHPSGATNGYRITYRWMEGKGWDNY